MIVSRIEDISSENVDIEYKTKNGVGFCYLDPQDELLKEFTEDVTIPIYPGEKTKRQFYIVKDDNNLLINTVSVKVEVVGSYYESKTSLNYDDSFEKIAPNNTVTAFISQYPSGIIPITVFLENKENTVDNVNLSIEIDVD